MLVCFHLRLPLYHLHVDRSKGRKSESLKRTRSPEEFGNEDSERRLEFD